MEEMTVYLLPYEEWTAMSGSDIKAMMEDYVILGVRENIANGKLLVIPKCKETIYEGGS